jgi:chromosome segregation ATPase
MHRELEPLMAGKRNSKKVEKSAGFWCKNVFPVDYIRGVFQVEEHQKETIQEQAKISASKTDAEALTTDSSAIGSQVSEVSNQIQALCLQSFELSEQWNDEYDRFVVQNDQLTQLKTQSNFPNADLDALANQLHSLHTKLKELFMENFKFSEEHTRFIDRLAYKISRGNSDFSDLRNDLAAHTSALTAWKAKMTAFHNDVKIPRLVESGEALSDLDVPQHGVY